MGSLGRWVTEEAVCAAVVVVGKCKLGSVARSKMTAHRATDPNLHFPTTTDRPKPPVDARAARVRRSVMFSVAFAP
eukprot:scaffold104713_cov78-Phaeocystis_antarctica.AAC.1